jgi:cyanophycin synthetase
VLVFGDNIKRTWKQIIYFNAGARGEGHVSKTPAPVALPEVGGFSLAADLEIISDERGVRIARGDTAD